jgi:hypothetical protein
MFWSAGRPDSAADYYRSAVLLWPHSRPLYLDAGLFANEVRHPLAARWFAIKALEQFPEDPAFLRRLAVASLILADTATARDAMRRGLLAAPDDQLLLMMREELDGR